MRALRGAPTRLTAVAGVWLGVYTALTLLFFRSAWAHPQTTVMGASTDPPQTMWFLRWMPYALAHHQDPLLTERLNVPDGANLMWNTAQPLTALVLSPFTLTIGPVATYDLLVTLAVASSALSAYLLLRALGRSAVAAALGGWLYGFSPYMTGQALGHANLVLVVAPPLLVLLGHEILVRQRWAARRSGALLGALAGTQLLVSEDILASAGIMAVITGAVVAVLHRDQVRVRLRHALRSLAVAAAVFVVIATGPSAVQLFGPQRVAGPQQPADVYVTDALNLFVPTATQQVDPGRAQRIVETFSGNIGEQSGYLGVPLTAILIIVVLMDWKKSPIVRLAGLTGAGAVLLSFGPHLHWHGRTTSIVLPWRLIQSLPLLDNLLPSRFMLYAFLGAAVLLAVFVDDLRMAPRRFMAAGAALVAAALVVLLPRLDYASTTWTTPPYFADGTAARLDAGGVVLLAPLPSVFNPQGMLWQAESGMAFSMVGGYVTRPDARGHPFNTPGQSPTEQLMLGISSGTDTRPKVDSSVRTAVLEDLRSWGVEAIIVGDPVPGDPYVALFTAVMQREPVAVDGVLRWDGVAVTASAPG